MTKSTIKLPNNKSCQATRSNSDTTCVYRIWWNIKTVLFKYLENIQARQNISQMLVEVILMRISYSEFTEDILSVRYAR